MLSNPDIILYSAKSNEKGNGVAKKQSNSGKMTKQQIRSFFPKHRNIDKSTGVEYNVTYGGTTVKFTEFKLRTVKPKPKSYPNEEDQNGQNGSREGDNLAKNGLENNKKVQNGPNNDNKNNGIESNDVKTEIDQNETTEKSNRKTDSEQKNCQIPEAKPEPPREESKNEKNLTLPEPTQPPPPQTTDSKQNLPPGFEASAPKENFEAQFKNAFKNTNPKNPPKRGSEAESQKEFKNNISQSLKKSLNIGEEQKLEQGND